MKRWGMLYWFVASSLLVGGCSNDDSPGSSPPAANGQAGASAGVGSSGTHGGGLAGSGGSTGVNNVGGPVGGDATLSDPTSASGGRGAEGGGISSGEPEQPVGIECLGGRADVEHHSAHCGMCGHACAPVVLASGLDWPVGIALNATTAFFITGGNEAQVMSVPLAGGEVAVLAEAQPFPMDIKVDATHVYWAGYGNIYKVPLTGGTRQPLLMAQIEAKAIALDSDFIYFANQAESNVGEVMKVPLEGGEPVTLVSTADTSPGSIAVDASYAYYVTRLAGLNSLVQKVPIGGGEPTTLAEGAIAGWAIALDASNVYWLEYASSAIAIDSALKKVSIAGGEAVTLATGTHMPSMMAIDGVSVYWTNQSTSQVVSAIPGTDGSVLGVPRAGGAMTQLGPDQYEPAAIATNGTTVCWTTTGSGQGGGSIMCLAVCDSGTCRASTSDL